MAQTQRAESFYTDLRQSLARFLNEWEHLQALRNNFDCLKTGDDTFFDAFFLTERELTYAQLYAVVVSINLIEAAMNTGPKVDFYKAQG